MDTYNDFNNQSEWLLVTPQVAQELLKSQIKNRPLNHFTVKKYANDMANGNWKQCGDTICVDKNGCLTDGQHRLHAIIESGIAVRMLLVKGVEHSIYKDTGCRRTLVGNIKIAADDICEEAKKGQSIELARYFSTLANDSGRYDISEVSKFLKQYEKDFVGYAAEIGYAGKTKGNHYMRATTLAGFFMAYINGTDIEILKACKEILAVGYSDLETTDPLRFRPMRVYDKAFEESRRGKKYEIDLVRKCCIAIRRVELNKNTTAKSLTGKAEYSLEFNGKNVRDIINGKELKE